MGNNQINNKLPPVALAFNHKKNKIRNYSKNNRKHNAKEDTNKKMLDSSNIKVCSLLNNSSRKEQTSESISLNKNKKSYYKRNSELQHIKGNACSNNIKKDLSNTLNNFKINNRTSDNSLKTVVNSNHNCNLYNNKNDFNTFINKNNNFYDKYDDKSLTSSFKYSIYDNKTGTLPTYNTDSIIDSSNLYSNMTPNSYASFINNSSSNCNSSLIYTPNYNEGYSTNFSKINIYENLNSKISNYQQIKNSRIDYYSKLRLHGLLGNKINSFNNIFIANWDDTLFCTSYLTPEGFFSDKLKTNEKVIKFMQKLEFSLVRLLSLAMANGCDVYIISNYDVGWIEETIDAFLPLVKDIIENYSCSKINLIYTKEFDLNNNLEGKLSSNLRDNKIHKKSIINNIEYNYNNLDVSQIINNSVNSTEYNKLNDNSKNSKYLSIKSIFSKYSRCKFQEVVFNVICFSDSISIIENLNLVICEIKDSFHSSSPYVNIYLKILKLKEEPEIEDLIKQQNLIADQFKKIYSSVRNINIKVKLNKLK